MTKYPKVKFIIDSNKEIDIYFAFLRDSQYRNLDREMKWAFYNPHPKLKVLKNKNLSNKEKRKILRNYLNNYYKKHLVKIKKNTLLIQKQWGRQEKSFFGLVDKIFRNYPWPKGRYIAYPTIWGMYPRDIKNKVFWFPFEHKMKNYPLVVIAHEMLHFIFYDYFYRNFPKYKKQRYAFKIWTISEIFNAIVQNQKEWVETFRQKSMTYPEHKKKIKIIKNKLRKNWNIEDFLGKIIRLD